VSVCVCVCVRARAREREREREREIKETGGVLHTTKEAVQRLPVDHISNTLAIR
jgi:hypothetical protein